MPHRMEINDNRRRVVSEAEAATHVNLSLVHFRRLRREGRGPRYVKLGVKRVGYRLSDLDEWIEVRLSDAA